MLLVPSHSYCLEVIARMRASNAPPECYGWENRWLNFPGGSTYPGFVLPYRSCTRELHKMKMSLGSDFAVPMHFDPVCRVPYQVWSQKQILYILKTLETLHKICVCVRVSKKCLAGGVGVEETNKQTNKHKKVVLESHRSSHVSLCHGATTNRLL